MESTAADAGIAATCPNAAVEHCHGASASPCDDSCAYCYVVLAKHAPVTRCPHCERRKLCSDECRQHDWEVHQHYCGIAGEKNIDWAIQDCSQHGKGFGVVALRDFEFAEIIMVERCVGSCPADLDELLPSSVRAAAMALYGHNSEEKYDGYAMGRLGKSRGVFLNMGRLNHTCVPVPADHTWLDDKNCKILTACGKIPKGMEITFSYRGDMMLAADERKDELQRQWGFECACEACMGLEAGVQEYEKWVQYQKLDKKIGRLARKKKFAEALTTVELQLEICNAARFCPPVTFERCFFDLFQMHHALGNVHQAVTSATKAAEYAAMVWGKEADETLSYLSFAKNPSTFDEEEEEDADQD